VACPISHPHDIGPLQMASFSTISRLETCQGLMYLYSMCLVHFAHIYFKLQICLLEAVHMLADVSQVKTTNNNITVSILFIYIIHTPHIALTIHGFFASYTNEEHV
jgi:hypothetical protein